MKATINFRVEEEQKESLQILADERCVKISVIIREIISDYLWENKNEQQDEIILFGPFTSNTEEGNFSSKEIIYPLQ